MKEQRRVEEILHKALKKERGEPVDDIIIHMSGSDDDEGEEDDETEEEGNQLTTVYTAISTVQFNCFLYGKTFRLLKWTMNNCSAKYLCNF